MATKAAPEETSPAHVKPWLFVPALYFLQSVPVTIVQEVSVLFYRDLGMAVEPIARWTSLLSLPWALQLLLGPLVDLNGRKRNWILNGQLLIAIGLALTAFLLRLPNPFEITVFLLAVTAVTSALCNIATDGFYLLSVPRDRQATFVGVQSTCYRLGRLFCMGLLVYAVGLVTRPPVIPVRAQAGQYFAFVSETGQYTYRHEAKLTVAQGRIEGEDGYLAPAISVPLGTYGLNVSEKGLVMTDVKGQKVSAAISVAIPPPDAVREGANVTGKAPLSTFEALVEGPADPQFGTHPATAWSVVLLACAGIYAFGHFYNRAMLPTPPEDKPVTDAPRGETGRNILRTLYLLGLGVGGYFFLNAALRLTLHFVGPVIQNMTGFDPHGWILKPDNAIHLGTFRISFGSTGTEWFQLVLCAGVVAGALYGAKRSIRGTPMADALVSFVRQPGFPAIFGFILLYRFGEAMVTKMSALFLKDSLVNGGLAISNQQIGVVKGVIGIIGIILGGLVGGALVGKYGLKRVFLPIAIVMHIPNALYAFAAHQGTKLPLGMVDVPLLGKIPLTIAGIDFLEQFGYGFGFAAYLVYLMWVAQRGKFKTTHYAIGTGMGALCIATAGAVSGVLQKNMGYAGLFTWALILGIPGVITLFFIPHDTETKATA